VVDPMVIIPETSTDRSHYEAGAEVVSSAAERHCPPCRQLRSAPRTEKHTVGPRSPCAPALKAEPARFRARSE